MSPVRFRQAMLAYGALAVIGVATLDGDIQLVLLVFLAGLALKSYIALVRFRMDESEHPASENHRDHPPEL
ncbi:MAG: hypothetical protein R2729_25155 [Bryobacteraceae bacterium]